MGCNYAKSKKQKQAAKLRDKQREHCEAKVTFDNESEALKYAGNRKEAYECPNCGRWHHTHRKPRAMRPETATRKAERVLDEFR